ncbi:MAG: hypothetical protein ACREAA_18335 [Candidatus Polarisedimenticolia bacterium]
MMPMRTAALATALALAVLAPLWWFPFVATQDGPSHLYNTSILLGWSEPGSIFPQVFERDLTPGPNWMGTAALYVLMSVAEPVTAERILLTLYVLGMTAAWWGWASSFERPAGPVAALGPLLAMSFFLFKGFYSFCLSLPLFLAAITLAWRWRGHPLTAARAALLNVLLAATWLAHLVSFGAAWIASASILALGCAPRDRRPAWRRALWLAPALLLAVSGLATASDPSSGRRWDWGRIVLYILRGEWLVYAGPGQMVLGGALMLLLAGLGVLRVRSMRMERDPGGAALALVAPAAAIWALCFVLPRSAGGGDFLTDRLAIFPVLLLAPLAAPPPGRLSRGLVAAAVAVLTLAQAGITWTDQRRGNDELAEYLALDDALREGSVLLPLTWEAPGPGRVSVLRHAGCHYAMRAKAVNLADYEARTGHFQIRFKEPAARDARVPLLPELALIERDPSSLDVRPLAGWVDYLITWDLRGAAPERLDSYQQAWEVAQERGRLILFRRRPS